MLHQSALPIWVLYKLMPKKKEELIHPRIQDRAFKIVLMLLRGQIAPPFVASPFTLYRAKLSFPTKKEGRSEAYISLLNLHSIELTSFNDRQDGKPANIDFFVDRSSFQSDNSNCYSF